MMMDGVVMHASLARALLPKRRAEQIMGMPAEMVRRTWTAREVRQLIADAPEITPRYELIDGDLVVTPSPTKVHQRSVLEFVVALKLYCDKHRVGLPAMSPSDVELEPESVRQPDIYVESVAEGKRVLNDGFPTRELMLVVEVLSPSTAHVDRVRKRALYQRHVPEYWIVDTDARVVERWRPRETGPEVLSERMEWHPAGAPEPMVVDLVALFARVWLEDV